jgi:HAD superfamily hydrolase (TIGR01509 family)
MRKAVLFDLDDTIYDHQHSRRSALTSLMEAYPAIAGHTLRKLELIHERHLQTTHSLLLAGQISPAEGAHTRMRLLFSDLGVALSDGELPRVENIYRRAYDGNRRAVPGVIPIISALKQRDMKIAIITNGLVIVQEEKIRFCGLEGKMDAVIISEKVGLKKPHEGIFHLALSELGISAREAVVIGDSWKLDVLGARNAGISAVWFNRYEEKCPEPGSVVEVTSLEPVEHLISILAG